MSMHSHALARGDAASAALSLRAAPCWRTSLMLRGPSLTGPQQLVLSAVRQTATADEGGAGHGSRTASCPVDDVALLRPFSDLIPPDRVGCDAAHSRPSRGRRFGWTSSTAFRRMDFGRLPAPYFGAL